MSPDDWITVPNWDRFQHYHDRVPPWIKLYLELLDKREFESISDSAKGLLLIVWLLFARHRGPFQRHKLATYVRDARTLRQLESLNHAGFVTLSASKPLALEKRREEKKRKQPASTQPKTEPRSNAGAYRPFQDNGANDQVPLEQIEQYLADLQAPPQ